MLRVRRISLLLAVAALALPPAALAAQGEPQKQHTAADTARARAMVLRLRDLPGSGWKGKRDTSPNDSTRCAGFEPNLSDLVETGQADSLEFSHPAGAFVGSSATLFRSVADANAAFDRVVRPGLARCLRAVVAGTADRTTKVAVLSSARVAHPRRGDESRAYRLRARLTAGGRSFPLVLDIVAVRRGRADALVLAANLGRPLRGLATLSALVAARMAQQ